MSIKTYGADVTLEQQFKINLTHAFQRKNPSKLDEFAKFDWLSSFNIDHDNNDNIIPNATNCDFITVYMTNRLEDMAEVYGVFYVRPERFRAEYEEYKNSVIILNTYNISYNLKTCSEVKYNPDTKKNEYVITDYENTTLYQKYLFKKQ